MKTGDKIVYRPTNEVSLVAWAGDEYVTLWRTPIVAVRIKDCKLLDECSDEFSLNTLKILAKESGFESARRLLLFQFTDEIYLEAANRQEKLSKESIEVFQKLGEDPSITGQALFLLLQTTAKICNQIPTKDVKRIMDIVIERFLIHIRSDLDQIAKRAEVFKAQCKEFDFTSEELAEVRNAMKL